VQFSHYSKLHDQRKLEGEAKGVKKRFVVLLGL
jgi:hypothetical protein